MRLWVDFAKAFLLDFGVYIATIAGVIVSRYIPAFRAGEPIDLSGLGAGTLIVAAVLALAVTAAFDSGGDAEAKRKPRNVLRRFASAVLYGISWHYIIGGG